MQKEVAWTRRLSDGDGFLVIHHGETAESCNRGRSGVAGNRWFVGPAQQKRAGACGAVVGRGGEDPHGLQRLCTDQGQHLFPKRLMLSWIREPRVAGGQEMTYGRSLQRHLNHFDLPTVLTEWAHLAQDRAAGWRKLVTAPPFAIGKPFVRQPWGDTRLTPENAS